MERKNLIRKFKAAVVGAAVAMSAVVTPVTMMATSYSIVSAATGSVSIGKTLITTDDDSATSTRATRFKLAGLGSAETVTLNFNSEYVGDITVGIGYNMTGDYTVGGKTPYWYQAEGVEVANKGGAFSVTYKFPADIAKYVDFAKGEMEVAIWWPQAGEEIELVSASSDGSGPVGPGPGPSGPTIIETQNAKSGSWTFVDNKDGTATITSTLTKEAKDVDYTLTAGFDEETYEKEGVDITPDLPINSHKFTFSEFGINDLSNVKFESFNYVVEAPEEGMATLMYGGGINVEPQSPADTEYACGKNGYWYNDHGADEEILDVDGNPVTFEIEIGNGYTIENAGSYNEVVWDIPKDVQPYVSKNPSDTVGFQYWYGVPADGDYENDSNQEGSPVKTVQLTGASCTYTRAMTVPYTTTKNVKIGEDITFGSDEATNQYKYDLSQLGLGERDKLSAVKFNLSADSDVKKFVGGLGISVKDTCSAANVESNWYNPGDFVILNPSKDKIEVMWIFPLAIREELEAEYGNVMIGGWYGGEATKATLKSIDFYYYVSTEPELEVATNLNIKVGETKKIKTNIEDCTFETKSPLIAEVDENGNVTGMNKGSAIIVVTSPDGQVAEITVNVTAEESSSSSTSATTATSKSSSSSTTVTTEKKDEIDWTRVKYGDVNLDGEVDLKDLVSLSKYFADSNGYALSATSMENADVVYDHTVGNPDAVLLMKFVAGKCDISELGPHLDYLD